MPGIFLILLFVSLAVAFFAKQRYEVALASGIKAVMPGGQTAAEVAREFLDANGADDVKIMEHSATVTDYFDPKRRCLFLHRDVTNGRSAAAWAIALHEAAHAAQPSAPVEMRLGNIKLTRYVPALTVLAFVVLGFLKRVPFPIGLRITAVIWFVVMLLNVMSLAVEFNASARAMAFLERKLSRHHELLEHLPHILKGVAWRDTAAFLRSPLYCLFGLLPAGGKLRPQ